MMRSIMITIYIQDTCFRRVLAQLKRLTVHLMKLLGSEILTSFLKISHMLKNGTLICHVMLRLIVKDKKKKKIVCWPLVWFECKP